MSVDRVKLDLAVRRFVGRHAGAAAQRSAEWYNDECVGGSEIGSVLGACPYKSFWSVVEQRVLGKKFFKATACDFGTLFEDVVTRFIEIDCDTTVHGTEICIRNVIPGHRHSPDGLAVVGIVVGSDDDAPDGEETWHLWTSERDDFPDFFVAAMIEIKTPYSRLPNSKIPRQYLAQPQSGLAVAPVCALGLFVDAVLRRCSLPDLGPSGAYDTAYHSRDTADDGARLLPAAAAAWGFTAVFAPTPEAPVELRIRGASAGSAAAGGDFDFGFVQDVSSDAWRIFRACQGAPLTPRLRGQEVVDLGAAPAWVFDLALGHAASGMFPAEHSDPCFWDGRGAPVPPVLSFAKRAPSPHYFLLGVIPWKIFSATYILVDREPGFRREIAAAVGRVREAVAAARAAPDPAAHLRAASGGKLGRGRSALSEGDTQDFFDAIG